MPRTGPRALAVAGGIVLGLGYILGGLLGSSFVAQFICIGLIGGAGIGLGYVVPIAVGVKWFPDKKGLVSGLAVAGFGFGALLWIQLAGRWFGGLLNIVQIGGLPGVQSVFIVYGIVFGVLVLLGSAVMINPPNGYAPRGYTPPEAAKAGSGAHLVDYATGQMLRTPQYYGLLLMFTGSALAGLMVIGCIKLFGIDALVHSEAVADRAAAGKVAATAASLLAILNGLGRIAWGSISDKIGARLSLFLMCALQGVIMLLFFHLGRTELGLIIGACIIGFNFGGNFALFPVATAGFFGTKHLGANYGWVFLAYGVAGIAGPQVAGYFKDAASGGEVGAWIAPFVIAGVACLASAALAAVVRKPKATALAQAEQAA
jgi:MFS transporter, OFA family, oxalate/formate antiporter